MHASNLKRYKVSINNLGNVFENVNLRQEYGSKYSFAGTHAQARVLDTSTIEKIRVELA